jgi:stage III sporulation protein AH
MKKLIEKVKKFFTTKTAKSLGLAAFVLLVGLAVYLNYEWFYSPLGNLGYGEGNMDSNGESSDTSADAENEENNYFTATALTRKQSRDEAIDVLKLVSESEDTSAEAKADAEAKISKIAVDIQNEANIESLVKAKGFSECVAIISDSSVSVIVGAESLQAQDVAQIFSIVYDTTGIPMENISVINK